MTIRNPRLAVALPTSSFLPALGGVEVGLHNIAERLVARGHSLTVIAPWPHVRELASRHWQLPYPVVPFPPKVWGVLRHMPALGLRVFDQIYARLQRQHRFSVWHGTMGYPIGVTLAHFAAARGLPHIVRCAGEDIQRDSEIGYGLRLSEGVNRLIRDQLVRSDRLVAITDTVAKEYEAIGVEPGRIARIPNGVALDRFEHDVNRGAIRAQYGIDPQSFMFLSVGRNHPKKNYATLVEATAKLRSATQLAFVVVIVGDGTERLREMVKAAGLSDVVHLLPAIGNPAGVSELAFPAPALVELYRAADAFVFPSRIETFGIAIVEAMAAGLPVVTTDAPGCRDVVREGRDALIVDPSSSHALAEAMRQVCEDASLRDDLAGRARARAMDFTWDAIADSYTSLYHEIIAERSINGLPDHARAPRTPGTGAEGRS